MDMRKEPEIPFIDVGDDDGDYRNVTRTNDGFGKNSDSSVTSDSETERDTDAELATVLAPNLNPNLRVTKIQLETVSSPTRSLVLEERQCQGSDTLHTNRKTVRRDYTDV